MGVPLEPISTSAYQVGTTGKIDWTGLVGQGGSVGTRAGRGYLRILNESGCGIKVTLQRGLGDHIPAGGWLDLEINGDNSATIYVEYVMAGPSPNLILATVYAPGEAPPTLPVLGNSPVGVGGTVATSSGTSIQNDGNGPGTSIIEATPNDQAASAIQVYNDGSGFWKILSAGSLRTLLNIVRGNATTGHAVVDIGDAADRTAFTFHGALDSLYSDGGHATSDGAGNLTATSFNGPLHGNADTATSATTAGAVASNGGSTSVPQMQTGTAGAGLAAVDDKANGLLHIYPTENDATGRSVQLDYVTSAGARSNGPHVTTDDHPWRWPGHMVDGQGNDFIIGTTFSGTGAGTYSFTFFGSPQKTPRYVTITPNELNSTQTVGVDSMGTNSVHVNMPNAWPFYGAVGIC